MEDLMLRELFPFAFTSDEAPGTGHAGQAEQKGSTPVAPVRPNAESKTEIFATFEEVYRGASVRPSKVAYTILKVSEMTNNAHLSGMSAEAKRCSLLMALEAAGVAVDDLLQDAMVRQRALNDYEESLQKKLKEFEGGKLEENRQIQAELDRLTAVHINRIQANLDELARQQDLFRAWQKEKQQEARRITDAASICVPPNAPANNGDSLTLVIERVTGQRR
jgi:hypothetical protein